MKFRIPRKSIFVIVVVLVSSMFLVGDTIYLPLVMGTGAAAADEVFVPASIFQMGCEPEHNGGYACSPDESPIHPVIMDAYYIDKYEVTNAQYKVCVTEKGCSLPSETTAYDDPRKSDRPVVYVDWAQSQVYCSWSGGRLPTEAEWEKAARGDGYPRAFPWGEASADARWANFDFNEGGTVPVGSYPAGVSPYGVHDMVGNVYEWVNDWYADNYYSDPSAVDNPQGPASGDYRVLRGGGWDYSGSSLRLAARSYNSPTLSHFSVGFRCARTP